MSSTKKLVMIADADPYVRELVRRFLTDSGYEVLETAEGYQALDEARKMLPIAIFADVMLPKLDGLSLCRLLKGDPTTQGIVAVVVVSVLEHQNKALTSGADAFLKKPLEKSKVLKILAQAAGEHQ